MAPRWTAPIRARVATLTIVVVVILLLGGLLAVWRGAHGYYALAPGSAPSITASSLCKVSGSNNPVLPNGQPCALLVVPADKIHSVNGSLFMVDVLIGPASPAEYLESKLGLLKHFHEGMVLVPSKEILGTTPSGQLNCQNVQMMQASTSYAAVVALRRLGYHVGEDDLGAQIDQVEPGSPAATAGIRCDDLVTGINGQAVHTSDQLAATIHAMAPGQKVKLTLQRAGSGGAAKTVEVTATLSGTPALSSQEPANPHKVFLGVAFETRTNYSFPFSVSIQVGDIGGPSAGLALTLGLLDVLSNGQLTGGHRVAATGTINLDGSVGDVGGVAQKAVAVRKAGAQYFLVPTGEYRDALSQAGSMKVFAVATLQQALDDLKSLGGQIPAPAAVQNMKG